MKKLLLVINIDAYGRQMVRWASIIKAQGDWEPVVFISAHYMERHVASCRAQGISILSSDEAFCSTVPSIDQPVRMEYPAWQRFKTVLKKIPGFMCLVRLCRKLISPFGVFSLMLTLSRQTILVRDLIRQNQIDALMIAESSPDYGASVFIEAAHREGILVVTAITGQLYPHSVAENYITATFLNLKCPLNRLVAAIYPWWVIAHGNNRLIRTQRTLLLAQEWLGIAPPHPWQLVGNNEDVVVVDSQHMFFEAVLEGISPTMLAVIGRAEHDIMSDILRNPESARSELYTRLGFRNNLPMLLSALVQDHYVTGRPQCDFQEYEKLLEFWVRSLGAIKGYNVVVNLHPGHTIEDSSAYEHIEQFGVKICDQDLATLVPLCDIYVAAGSSTIPWAIACGKPVINYDIYRYEGPLASYGSALGVVSVQEQHEFTAALERLTTDKAYYSHMAELQASCAEQWGRLDGKTVERLTDLLDGLTENSTKN